MITGWILYRRRQNELLEKDHAIHRLLEAAHTRKINLKVYAPEQFDIVVTDKMPTTILLDGQPVAPPDFLLPRMGSFTTDTGLAVIRQLENLGVQVCNSAAAIETVSDKLRVHQLLAMHQLPMPKTLLAKFPADMITIKRELTFPIVVKNITGTEGIGIYLCDTEQQLKDILDLIYSHNLNAAVLLQEFIANSRGRDLRVFVLGGRVIGCMQRSSTVSFKANFSQGGQVTNFPLTPEIEKLALKVADLLQLKIAGIDLLFGEHGYLICEANSSPWFKGLEQVIGAHVAEEIIDYLIENTRTQK